MINADYEKAKALGLTSIDRWGTGKDHHPMSERLMAFIQQHDRKDYGDHFCWKKGGDGDNGESLMFEMDAFFELMDKETKKYTITFTKEEAETIISGLSTAAGHLLNLDNYYEENKKQANEYGMVQAKIEMELGEADRNGTTQP